MGEQAVVAIQGMGRLDRGKKKKKEDHL